MSFPESISLERSEIMRHGTIQVVPLATRGFTSDGRIFRYCKAGGAITAGKMVQMEAPSVIGSVPQTSNMILYAGITVGTTWGEMELKNMSAYMGSTLMAADDFKEGYIYVGGTGHPTGIGQMFQIKSHGKLTASSTNPCTFNFVDGEKPEATFTTDVAIGFCKNSYDDVIAVVTAAEPTAPVLGVAPCGPASGDYFWVQTWGKCVAYVGAATTARAPLIGATDAAVTGLALAAAIAASAGNIYPGLGVNAVIATAPNVIVAGGYAPVELKISP